MKLKLPVGYKIERDLQISDTFYFYKIPKMLEKSNSYTCLKSLIKDCIDYDDRLSKLEKIKLKPGFRIEIFINDPVNYLYYKKERIATSGIIEDLISIAEKAKINYDLIEKLNNGEEVEIY